MKKIYDPEDVLMAVIQYYANNDCDNIDVSVTAKFLNEESSVELEIESNTLPNNLDKKVLN